MDERKQNAQNIPGMSEQKITKHNQEEGSVEPKRFSRSMLKRSKEQLAAFRRELTTQEELLRQCQHDRKAKEAFVALEDGRRKQESNNTSNASSEYSNAESQQNKGT